MTGPYFGFVRQQLGIILLPTCRYHYQPPATTNTFVKDILMPKQLYETLNTR